MHWSQAACHGLFPPDGLRSHSATLVGSKVFIFGGGIEESNVNSDEENEETLKTPLWIFDTETMFWHQAETSGVFPKSLRAHTATLVNNKIYIFGGGSGSNYYDKLYILDTQIMRWETPEIKGTLPGPRRAHTATLVNKKIYIFGGGDGKQPLNDMFILDTEKMEWVSLQVSGSIPPARGYHTAVLVGDDIYVYGGFNAKENFPDIHLFNTKTNTWSVKQFSNPEDSSRFAHSATMVGSWMLVFGGRYQNHFTNDLQLVKLDVKSEQLRWITKPLSGSAPSPRGYHTVVYCDSRIFLIGGMNDTDRFGDVHILDLGIFQGLLQ